MLLSPLLYRSRLGYGLLLVLWSLIGSAQAQSTLTGLVSSETNAPLAGVSVVLKGTTTGTTTDAEGRFRLAVPGRSTTLVFSSVGYTTQELVVGNQTDLRITLQPDEKSLNEVVVIGYGTQSRRQVTAAVGSLKVGELQDLPVTSPVSLLQGRVSGVNITQGSGQPGSSINVRVRGVSSVAGSEPLYIIDGVQIKSGNFSQIATDGQAGYTGFSALADLNPNDIEDIQILKDASAAAIYGSRATNGVVIITTKKGKTGKGTIGFNANVGVGQPTNRLDLLNTAQLKEIVRNSFTRSGIPPTRTAGAWNGQSAAHDTTLSINYQDEVLARQSAFQDYNLSFSGGRNGVVYALSAGYTNQEGSLINTGLKRYTARLNTEAALNDRVTAGASVSYTNARNQSQDENGNIQPLYRALAFTYPTQRLYEADGSFANLIQNPVQALREIQRYYLSNRIIGRLYANIELSKKWGVFFKPSLSTDALFFEENRFVPSTYLRNGNRRATEARNRTNVGLISENLLTLSRTFGKHQLDALGGYSYQRETDRTLGVAVNGGITDAVQTINGGAAVAAFSGARTFWTLESVFAQANYNFADRYLLSATIRRDGSSKFGEGKRYGYFPSVSAGWRISDEGFMKDVTAISDLKLRASTGVTGSLQGLGDFQSQGIYETGRNYEGLAGIGIGGNGLANPRLSWETTTQSDIGLDLSLFNRRANVVADYYVKRTKGILFDVLLPLESGFGSIADNVGEMLNRGWELAINTKNVTGTRFTWESSFNISQNRNKVTSLPVASGGFLISGGGSTFYSVLMEGQPVNSYYLLPSNGIYQTNDEAATAPVPPLADAGQPSVAGDLKWIDKNGDGRIDINDRELMGTPLPIFTGGLNNSLTYGNFSLDFLFQFSWGNKLFNALKNELNYRLDTGNKTTDLLDAWSPTNPTGKWPRNKWDDYRRNGHVFQSPADIYLEDGSYTRLKAATLSYRLPVSAIRRLGMSSARIYVAGTNLLTFTKYSGYDPESMNLSYTATYAGVDRGNPPLQRAVSMGVSVQF
jgi:TonB-linked SusC/RagA family outer membrane protein